MVITPGWAPGPERPQGAPQVAPARPAGAEADLVARELEAVERRLAAVTEGAEPPLPEVVSHLVGAGGKRLRPRVLLLAARAHGLEGDALVSLAVAAELVHSATLLHDDVVDEAETRRGRTVASRLWGNALAVLAGDFCLSAGLAEISRAGDIRAVRTLSATVIEMAEGEVIQLRGRGRLCLDEDIYRAVIERKTAALMAWCARVGGLLPAPADRALEAYGRALGVAFQIADDILDYEGDAAETGKGVGVDLGEGKATLPLIEACRRLPALRAELEAALPEGGLEGRALRGVVERVTGCGAVEAARTAALGEAARAVAALGVLPQSPYRAALEALAWRAARRSR